MGGRWWHTFDDQFWIMVAGLILAFLTTVAKSKCSRMACCGCEIERNISAEVQLERARMQTDAVARNSANPARAGSSPLTNLFNNATFSNIPQVPEPTQSV